MTAIFLALAGLWLFAGLIKLARPRKPTLFRHQLSDKDSLIVVMHDGKVVWVGTYSADPTLTDDRPDWLRQIARH
jgi:hypothetical protein